MRTVHDMRCLVEDYLRELHPSQGENKKALIKMWREVPREEFDREFNFLLNHSDGFKEFVEKNDVNVT